MEFPNLSRMARDFLSIPETTVPIERRFSNGADLVIPNRANMLPETIQMCLELQEFLRFGGNELFDIIMHEMERNKDN